MLRKIALTIYYVGLVITVLPFVLFVGLGQFIAAIFDKDT